MGVHKSFSENVFYLLHFSSLEQNILSHRVPHNHKNIHRRKQTKHVVSLTVKHGQTKSCKINIYYREKGGKAIRENRPGPSHLANMLNHNSTLNSI